VTKIPALYKILPLVLGASEKSSQVKITAMKYPMDPCLGFDHHISAVGISQYLAAVNVCWATREMRGSLFPAQTMHIVLANTSSAVSWRTGYNLSVIFATKNCPASVDVLAPVKDTTTSNP